VVAVWSQSGALTSSSGAVTGPLSWGFGGPPRGIRTPNRQIRSQPSPIPAPPSHPLASPLVLVNGRVAGPSRASVPARHAWHGRNVVAVSGCRRQTGGLATRRFLDQTWRRASARAWAAAARGCRAQLIDDAGQRGTIVEARAAAVTRSGVGSSGCMTCHSCSGTRVSMVMAGGSCPIGSGMGA